MAMLGERDGTLPTELPEPFGSLLAFLSDLHEQVELQQRALTDELSRQVLEELKVKLEAMALIVTVSARG